jgi:membrane protein
VIRSVGLIAFCRRVWDEVSKDNLFTWASALAYSWLFAIFPFFIFLLSLVPYLPNRVTRGVTSGIHQLVDQLPGDSANLLWKNIESATTDLLHRNTGPLLIVGLVIALWSASGGMANTMSALDRVYELDAGRPLWLNRLMGLVLTIVCAALLVVVVGLLPVGTLVKIWLVKVMGISKFAPALVAFDIVRWMASVVLMISILMVIYHFGPAIKQRFTWISPGAVFALVVWVALGLLFRFYIEKIGGKGYARTYGTVGGVAILLLFFYLDALVLLIGAEINSEIDFEVLKVRRGSRDFRTAQDLSLQTDGL